MTFPKLAMIFTGRRGTGERREVAFQHCFCFVNPPRMPSPALTGGEQKAEGSLVSGPAVQDSALSSRARRACALLGMNVPVAAAAEQGPGGSSGTTNSHACFASPVCFGTELGANLNPSVGFLTGCVGREPSARRGTRGSSNTFLLF